MTIPNFQSAQGTTFAFAGETYLCTDINEDKSAPSRERMEMTTLELPDGSEARMVYGPIRPKRDPKKFSISYKTVTGTDPIEEGAEGTLTTTGTTGTYRCTKSNTARKTKSFVEGTAEFEEVITEEDIASGS
jgi:hypothetical protein